MTSFEPNVGGKPNERISYKAETGHGNKCQIIRIDGHETMLNFIGSWFPRNNVKELEDIYCISILTLLCPWTDLSDLVTPRQTLKGVFDHFIASCNEHYLDIINNIQYQHNSFNAAQKKKRETNRNSESEVLDINTDDHVDQNTSDCTNPDDVEECQFGEFIQHDVEVQLANKFSQEEKLYAEVAINIAVNHGIFRENTTQPVWKPLAKHASEEEMESYLSLQNMVKAVTKNRIILDSCELIQPEIKGRLLAIDKESSINLDCEPSSEQNHLSLLNSEQR